MTGRERVVCCPCPRKARVPAAASPSILQCQQQLLPAVFVFLNRTSHFQFYCPTRFNHPANPCLSPATKRLCESFICWEQHGADSFLRLCPSLPSSPFLLLSPLLSIVAGSWTPHQLQIVCTRLEGSTRTNNAANVKRRRPLPLSSALSSAPSLVGLLPRTGTDAGRPQRCKDGPWDSCRRTCTIAESLAAV